MVRRWMLRYAAAGLAVLLSMSCGGEGKPNGDATSPQGSESFALALLLGIAYAASIGGLGTLIGTPPNALLAAFLSERYGVEIGFAQWMLFGVPLASLLLALTWLLLTRIAFHVDRRPIAGAAMTISRELEYLGPLRREERLVKGTPEVPPPGSGHVPRSPIPARSSPRLRCQP